MLNNTIKAENGYVVLPIEEYNKLIVLQANINSMIKLSDNYDGQVSVDIDSSYIYSVARKLYEASEFNTPERELKPRKDFSVWASLLTLPVPTDENE